MSAHPTPEQMAQAAHLGTMPGDGDLDSFAAGVAAERERVAADLRAKATAIRGRQPNEGAMIVVAYLETYADDLEGKR